MNQELKNMELVVCTLELSLSNGDFNAAKTISNTYERMISTYSNKNYKEELNEILFKQLAKIQKLYTEIVESFIPNVISKGDYKAMHTLQLISDRLDLILNDFKRKIENYKAMTPNVRTGKLTAIHKGEKIMSTNDIEKILDLSVKTGSLITQINDKLRGTGKTTALVKKASELGCVLVVPNKISMEYAEDIASALGVSITIIPSTDIRMITMPQYRDVVSKGFLIDDVNDFRALSKLRNSGYKLLGGFNSLNDNLHKPKTELEFLNKILIDSQNEIDVINATYCGVEPSYVMVNKTKLIRKIEALKEVIKHFENK